jgi:hypothetical protein
MEILPYRDIECMINFDPNFWIGMHVKQPTIAYSRHNNIGASEWLLFIAKGAMFQLYHGENKLI